MTENIADEWMAAELHARAEDDTHRTITDVDFDPADDPTLYRLTAAQIEQAERVHTAIHEAGHAVLALHFGWGVYEATINPGTSSDGTPTAGHVNLCRGINTWEAALVDIAGIANLYRLGYSGHDATFGSGHDLDNIRAAGHDPEDIHLWNRVMEILDERDVLAGEIAGQLLARGTLDEFDLVDIWYAEDDAAVAV